MKTIEVSKHKNCGLNIQIVFKKIIDAFPEDANPVSVAHRDSVKYKISDIKEVYRSLGVGVRITLNIHVQLHV